MDVCFTKSSRVNSLSPSATYMHHQTRPSLVQIMACWLYDAKPLSKPMVAYFQLDMGTYFNEIWIKVKNEENEIENVISKMEVISMG